MLRPHTHSIPVLDLKPLLRCCCCSLIPRENNMNHVGKGTKRTLQCLPGVCVCVVLIRFITTRRIVWAYRIFNYGQLQTDNKKPGIVRMLNKLLGWILNKHGLFWSYLKHFFTSWDRTEMEDTRIECFERSLNFTMSSFYVTRHTKWESECLAISRPSQSATSQSRSPVAGWPRNWTASKSIFLALGSDEMMGEGEQPMLDLQDVNSVDASQFSILNYVFPLMGLMHVLVNKIIISPLLSY